MIEVISDRDEFVHSEELVGGHGELATELAVIIGQPQWGMERWTRILAAPLAVKVVVMSANMSAWQLKRSGKTGSRSVQAVVWRGSK